VVVVVVPPSDSEVVVASVVEAEPEPMVNDVWVE
jgi:hypothetical protein